MPGSASSAADAVERRRFACPPRQGRFGECELSLLDPSDPDDRHVLIFAEHPELARAIARGKDELLVAGERINPRLHLTMHEIVATQLWDDDPPEVWQTARRLLAGGYERHDVMHLLGSAAAEEIWHVMHEGSPFERERYARALAALS